MSAIDKGRLSSNKVYIICAAVAILVLAIFFGLHMFRKSQVAPVYELRVDGLEAQTPAEAQAACRGDYERFAEAMENYGESSWVWCGGKTLYLVKPDALTIDAEAEPSNFTAVKFKDSSGGIKSGHIVDPSIAPKELGRVELGESEEYTFENVSMTVRVGLRNGEIDYENAVYLWEKGSNLVLAVRPDTYEAVEGSIVSFTDDGNETHTCYILDTAID